MSAETEISFMDIRRAYAETEYGATMAARVRFSSYQGDISNQRWEQLLGADVNNLRHTWLSFGLGRCMVRSFRAHDQGFLDAEEEVILPVMGEVHDWAEGVPDIGDIDYNFKTDDDELAEQKHLEVLVPTVLNGVEPRLREAACAAVTELKSKGSKMWLVFNSLERIGYTRTALNAIAHANSERAPDCADRFRWLAADVIGNHVEMLLERSEVHAPVREFLKGRSEAFSNAFRSIPLKTFDNYESPRRAAKIEAFDAAQAAWQISPFSR